MASISSLGIGSGLDLSGLLDQMESAERQQLTPIVRQQNSYQAKISAFGGLESALTSFQEAATKLADAGTFRAVKAEVSGEALTVSAGENAEVGSYDIDISQKARGYSIASAGLAGREEKLGAGSIAFSLGNGDSFSVDVSEDQSSLEGIRDAINDADAGVSASIIDDGSAQPYRLVLSSTDTGTDAAIASVDFGSTGLGTSLALDTNTEVTARNAQLTVNGIAVESQSNRVEEAIQGVTLEIAETGTETLDITRDDAAVKKDIRAFVDAYNGLQKVLSTHTGYDSASGSAGTLLGNATVRGVESDLRDLMGDSVTGGAFSTLSDLGISLQLDGTLEIDDETLDEVVAEQSAALTDFFAGDEGFAGRLDGALESMLEEDGRLERAVEGLESRIEGLGEQYERTEARIGDTIARYRSQFAELDGLIAQMNSTSSYLTQQFEALNAQLGQ